MTLDELAETHPFAVAPTVPDWTLGCFKRRCITYASGEEDTSTEVIWVQSNGLTGDLRTRADRPAPDAERIEACSREVLIHLVKGDGFAARTAWDGEHMSWDAFAVFQPYTKWPEPGRLERVGASLIEWAPSGVYVEDWRMQAGSGGLSVGLELLGEVLPDGQEIKRGGGLVIAGDHAIRVVDRREALGPEPLHRQMAKTDDPAGLAAVIFDGEVSYAVRSGDSFLIQRSVNPLLEGGALLPGAFAPGAAEDQLVETAPSGSAWSKRIWRIDTLLGGQMRPVSTRAEPEGLAWLEREADTLLNR